MYIQRNCAEPCRFKDVSIEYGDGKSAQFTLLDSVGWEEIDLGDYNITTKFINISALSVYSSCINNGFAELKLFGCPLGMIVHLTWV